MTNGPERVSMVTCDAPLGSDKLVRGFARLLAGMVESSSRG